MSAVRLCFLFPSFIPVRNMCISHKSKNPASLSQKYCETPDCFIAITVAWYEQIFSFPGCVMIPWIADLQPWNVGNKTFRRPTISCSVHAYLNDLKYLPAAPRSSLTTGRAKLSPPIFAIPLLRYYERLYQFERTSGITLSHKLTFHCREACAYVP